MAANTPETEELLRIRTSLGLTIREFAKRLDEPEARYKNYEYGMTKVVPARVLEKARLLGLVRPVMSGLAPSAGIRSMKMVRIPVVGLTSAGIGESNVDPNEEPLDVPDFMVVDDSLGWRVSGDSMMPAIEHGDIAIFRPETHYRNGKTYLFQKDGELFIKKLRWKAGNWWMHSLNPSYEDMNTLGTIAVAILTGIFRVSGDVIETRSSFNGLDLPEWDE